MTDGVRGWSELIGSPVWSFQGLLHTQQSRSGLVFNPEPSRGKGPFRLVRGGGSKVLPPSEPVARVFPRALDVSVSSFFRLKYYLGQCRPCFREREACLCSRLQVALT
jgi:hypothetical protein